MALLEPVEWSSGRKQEFENWFHHQLFNAEGARGELEDKWSDELEEFRSKQPEGSKDVPFSGASNIEFPLVQQHLDPVLADLMQSLHAAPEFWNAKARRGQSTEHANAVVEALRILDQDFLNMRDTNKKGLLTTAIHGTGVYKSHWIHRRKRVRDYNAEGDVEKMVKTRSEPAIDHIPLQRFYFPPEAWSIHAEEQGGARWVAEKILLKENELRERAQSDGPFQPQYDPTATEAVLDFRRHEDEPVDEKIREQQDHQPFDRFKEIELFEVWAKFDVDGDGIDEEIFVVWHQDTGTILRALHNPFLHGKRPYEVINYLPTQGVYGIGIAEKDKWAQSTLSRLINAQVDNALIANTRMFSAPMGSGIQPGEPIYPGKIWLHDQGESVDAMQAGEVYPSLPQTISQFLEISEQVTGVSEARQGNVSELPSRTPAATTQSLLQQGAKRFDFILGNMRQPFGRLGMRVLQNLAQYYRQNPVRWQTYFQNAMGEEEADLIDEVLQQPIHNVERGFDITLQATSSTSNQAAERQNFLSMIQLLGQVGSQLIQLAQMAENQPPQSATAKTSAKLYQGGVSLMQELMDRFDLEQAEDILPTRLASQLGQMSGENQPAQGQQAAGGGGQQPIPGQTLGGLQGAPQPPSEAIQRVLGLGGS